MNSNFVFFCKTYNKDIERFKVFLKSFNEFNKDNIKLYVSMPELDYNLFKQFESENVILITDESYGKNYFVNQNDGLSVGYINQEICKLSFFETSLAQNYLCVDSDCQFIRDFYTDDFMADDNTPYTVLVQDKDLLVEKHYQSYGDTREQFIEKIYKTVGLEDRRYRTCHGMQVLNSKVLKSLKEDFMKKNNYSYYDLLKIAPFEFTWYNAWFQKCGLVKEMAVEPFFKTFHMRIDYVFSRLKLLKIRDLKRRYVGIVLNGNWKKPAKEYIKPNIFHKWLYNFLNKM